MPGKLRLEQQLAVTDAEMRTYVFLDNKSFQNRTGTAL